jgi:hypothetical protein
MYILVSSNINIRRNRNDRESVNFNDRKILYDETVEWNIVNV